MCGGYPVGEEIDFARFCLFWTDRWHVFPCISNQLFYCCINMFYGCYDSTAFFSELFLFEAVCVFFSFLPKEGSWKWQNIFKCDSSQRTRCSVLILMFPTQLVLHHPQHSSYSTYNIKMSMPRYKELWDFELSLLKDHLFCSREKKKKKTYRPKTLCWQYRINSDCVSAHQLNVLKWKVWYRSVCISALQ